MPVTYYTEQEYLSLKDELDLTTKRLAAAEALRPQWAMGYSDDSMAAQIATSSLIQIYEVLGVQNQTDCINELYKLIDLASRRQTWD
jgi:hypothetical protein